MQTYELTLASEVFDTFRCQKAANSLDIDAKKKSIHHFNVSADITTDFNIGLIVGASGSGKTTLATSIFGDDVFLQLLDLTQPVIDQFDSSYTYEECVKFLTGAGLTSVPCWIRPAYTLSNGQRARAEFALQMANNKNDIIVLDEWTSVVDRTVAKVMSFCIQKFARKSKRKIIILSCHYDVIEWLNPDWIIDCNKQLYEDRRLLCQNYQRSEQLQFDIRECSSKSWKYFSKYHYLSDRLAGAKQYLFGLYYGQEQIGFQSFNNYVAWSDKSKPMQMHSNRTVIHPDYAGLGLGILLINKSSDVMLARGYDVRAKFSSTPIYIAMSKFPAWRLQAIDRRMKIPIGVNNHRKTGFRVEVKSYSFKYIGNNE